MRINRVHMAVRIRTMHSLLLFHVAHGTRIHRWSIGETNDAFSPGASATTFWPFVRRTDPRAECRRARAETEDLPNDHSGIRGDSRGRLRGWRDEKFRTDQQTAPTWLQERERKPIDGWNATGEKEGRDEEREREWQSGRGGSGREYYEGRWRTKERRRGVTPFSRGSIDASASLVDFRAENADAHGRPALESEGGGNYKERIRCASGNWLRN